MIGNNKFIDKYGNFNNTKFLELLKKVKNAKGKASKKNTSTQIVLFKSVSKKEVRRFFNKLSSFINAGVDIKQAIHILSNQIKNLYLKKIVNEIKDNLDNGILMSETMKQYKKVFDPLSVSLIGIGEKTGNLNEILKSIDERMLEMIELKAKIKGSMIYPIILVSLTLIMITFMMVFIIPKITESFIKRGVNLPFLTQIVINISDYIREKWLNIAIYIAGLIIAVKLFNKTLIGELVIGKIIINLPIFGHIYRKSNTIDFISSFTMLLNAGVLLLEALSISANILQNIHYRREMIRVRNEVEAGSKISKALGLNNDFGISIYSNKFFEEEFAYIINTGEETGTLARSLSKLGDNYSKELKRYIGNMATMLEPFILIFVGLLVGTIVIAIMLPFFEMGKVIKKM